MWERFGARSVPGKIKLSRSAGNQSRGPAGPAPPSPAPAGSSDPAPAFAPQPAEVEDRRWTENGAAEHRQQDQQGPPQAPLATPAPAGDQEPRDGRHYSPTDAAGAQGTTGDDRSGIVSEAASTGPHEAAPVLRPQHGPNADPTISGSEQEGTRGAPVEGDPGRLGGEADSLGADGSAQPKDWGAAAEAEGGPVKSRAMDSGRLTRFKNHLAASSVDVDALKELSWSGVPPHLKPIVWRLLLGYAPPNSDRRESVLARRRKEYQDWVSHYYDMANEDRSEDEIHTLRQISVDCPRTVPDVPFFHQPVMQKALERILYVWAIRHPASGYVQGINDLVTPFLTVFLSEVFGSHDMATWPQASSIRPEALALVEADCFWCLCRLLDGIQDHYTFAQPGIQRLVFRLRELVRRIDDPVARHIEHHGLEFLQFAFRWFNCLLIREIPFRLVGRLWDTYLAEGDGFPEFLVYVCASFLLTWSDQLQKMDSQEMWSEQLQKMDFQEMVLFLQNVPTDNWTQSELEVVLSKAFMWRVLFNHAPKHLSTG